MKKLIIVGTAAEVGKGGISSALTGYISGLKQRNIDFDVIQSHNSGRSMLVAWFLAFISIAKLSIKYRSNAVFWFHCGPWLSLLRKFTLAIVPRIFGCSTVAHIHSATFNDYLCDKMVGRWLIKVTMLPFSSLVVLTPWWQKLLQKNQINKPTIICANPNSEKVCKIAEQYIKTPKITKNGNDKLSILTMTRIVDGKGVDTVIKALGLLPDNFNLIVAGDGDKLAECKNLSLALQLTERIKFVGWLNGEQKENLLRNADIFCLPSTSESFGMVFIEAMAFDLPVIANGWGPILDVVTPDVGVCSRQVDEYEIAKLIMDVSIDIDSFSGNGPTKVVNFYTPERVTKQIVDLLH